jgi:hypothetical protein
MNKLIISYYCFVPLGCMGMNGDARPFILYALSFSPDLSSYVLMHPMHGFPSEMHGCASACASGFFPGFYCWSFSFLIAWEAKHVGMICA